MRKTIEYLIVGTAVAGALVLAGHYAFGQDAADFNIQRNDPLTKYDATKWQFMMNHELYLEGIKGVSGVMIGNATPDDVTITCRGYTLVGPNPYKSVVGNPTSLPHFKVSFVKTNDFDIYCRNGLEATGNGNSYHIEIPTEGHSLDQATILWVTTKQ